MLSFDPEPAVAATPVPPPSSPYWQFYSDVAFAQLQAWLPSSRNRILDLSGDGPGRAQLLRDAGHEVVYAGPHRITGVHSVVSEPGSVSWLRDACLDGVVAEAGALSTCLAVEETARDLARVLRPGGRLLLALDSLVTGLAALADQGRWAELADVPSADVVLVPQPDGTVTRYFRTAELGELLADSGLEVEWVRPRSVLTPEAVTHALATGGPETMRTLVRTELTLATEHRGESSGLRLVASARKP